MRVPTSLSQWTLATIQQLLNANCIEDGRFDWKVMLPRDVEGKERIIRAAASMANAGGGFLIFGVQDNGEPNNRIVGVPVDNEFGRELSQQLHRADPPSPHSVQNPPLKLEPDRVVYVVEILSISMPHADTTGRYYVRTGGGTDQPLKTHQLRGLFRSDEVREAPGLNEIKKIAFTFLRPDGWDQIRPGLQTLAAYAVEGTPRQKSALLEALTRLAVFTRQGMPEDVLFNMLNLCEEAAPHSPEDAPELFDEAFQLAVEVAGHVGYDAALYMRHGFAVHTTARLLSQFLDLINRQHLEYLRRPVLEAFESCINAGRRAQPEEFSDAVSWYQYKRDHPARGHLVPPKELDAIEARLLGVRK